MVFLCVFYFKLIAVPGLQRLVVSVTTLIVVPSIALLASPFSELGVSCEFAIMIGAVLLGELCGRPYERICRSQFLKHGTDRSVAMHPVTLRLISDDD